MKKAALALTAFLVSVSCLQSSAWSKPSLLLQLPSMLASLKNSDTVRIVIGDDGLVQAFKGKKLRTDVKIFDGYKLTDRQGYIYSITNGPANLTISAEGVIEYDIVKNAETTLIPFIVLIKNKTTGKTYSKNVQLAVLETEVVASGTFGPEGGQAADEFEDVVLTVPPDTFTEQAFVEVLRAVGKEGYYAYTIKSSAPMLKAAQLRLPDLILRKAPEGSSAMLQSRMLFQQAQTGGQARMREEENGWMSWQKWKADYAEITTGINAKNRLPSNLAEKPAHEDLNNTTEESSKLLSLCKKESYETDCGQKTPVVFIHGYNLWGGLGGGQDTWGQLPELIKAEGYAVFEFTWKTNARFADAAADFAEAIGLIQEKSTKKVHIVAHSFGGLVSRAYLQTYATGQPYRNNVQSLLTLGTPHSGIFDGDGTYHGLFFKKGQDSSMFEGCMQISCHEAGEPTPEAYTIDPLFGDNIEINDYFGIDKNQGGFIAQIQSTSGEHGLPVDALALIGLPVGLPTNINNYKTGDNLITYAGQRFSRTWGNEIIKQEMQDAFGSGKVHEKILGVSDYDKEAIPTGKPSDNLVELWSKNNFKGYSHAPLVMDIGGASEAKVDDDSSNFRKTNAPHAALAEIKAWLKPSDDAEVPTVTSQTGRVWMDRNLGASRVATSSSDTQAYGDSYQWGRLADGHQKPTRSYTWQRSTTDVPGHDQYICMSTSNNYTDWRITQNDNLWQGVNGINNPCPTGFRIPTANEWQTEMDTWISKDEVGAFASPLKLSRTTTVHPACFSVGERWSYWSSTIKDDFAAMLTLDGISSGSRAAGLSVRCIKDEAALVPTVVSATGRIWMDRDLGASRVATSMTDAEAYGELYQWGRGKDGHENRTSETTATLSSSDTPGHAQFITASSEPYDWRNPQNGNLWQGIGGVNNPCPAGFRVPTTEEWQGEIDSWTAKDTSGAFASPLKLPLGGYRVEATGPVTSPAYAGSTSFYWSSTASSSYAYGLFLMINSGSDAEMGRWSRAKGGSIRCIKD